MTIGINQITSGMGLKIDGDIYVVQAYHHVKPGKGSAFVRVKIRNLITNAVLDRTFRTADKLEDVALEERNLEYLYRTGNEFHFMDHHSYEQVVLDETRLGDTVSFLLENLEVVGILHDQRVLKVVLPNFIIAEIVETEPGIRGDSSRSGTKPAKIATGTTIQVPLFVDKGETVRIDTRSGEYVERIQK